MTLDRGHRAALRTHPRVVGVVDVEVCECRDGGRTGRIRAALHDGDAGVGDLRVQVCRIRDLDDAGEAGLRVLREFALFRRPFAGCVDDGEQARQARLVGDEHVMPARGRGAVERRLDAHPDLVTDPDVAQPARARPVVADVHDVDVDLGVLGAQHPDRVPAQLRAHGIVHGGDGAAGVAFVIRRGDDGCAGRRHEEAEVLVGAGEFERAEHLGVQGDAGEGRAQRFDGAHLGGCRRPGLALRWQSHGERGGRRVRGMQPAFDRPEWHESLRVVAMNEVYLT